MDKSTFLKIFFFDFWIFENRAMPHFFPILVIFVDMS
jgi:hypothetical protein